MQHKTSDIRHQTKFLSDKKLTNVFPYYRSHVSDIRRIYLVRHQTWNVVRHQNWSGQFLCRTTSMSDGFNEMYDVSIGMHRLDTGQKNRHAILEHSHDTYSDTGILVMYCWIWNGDNLSRQWPCSGEKPFFGDRTDRYIERSQPNHFSANKMPQRQGGIAN